MDGGMSMRVARLLNLHIRYNLYYVSLLQHQTVLYERLTWRIRQRVLSVQDVVLVWQRARRTRGQRMQIY